MAHRPDVLELLTDAHAEAERLVAAYEAVGDPERRTALAARLVTAVERRTRAEEAELDPVLCRVLPDGEEVVAAAARLRAEAAEAARRLRDADPGSPEAGHAAGALLARVREWARAQSGTGGARHAVFPRLRERLTPRERRRAGAAVARRLAGDAGDADAAV
ncbi:hypothetical protein SALCHL_001238 [Streptomyces albus subsp. chlorinus]|uniref:hypothetical protein n=1 Tax=Streptomyces albus TaxID=1888 RepID=UPI003D0DA8CC